MFIAGYLELIILRDMGFLLSRSWYLAMNMIKQMRELKNITRTNN
jgi:hypothetical protein